MPPYELRADLPASEWDRFALTQDNATFFHQSRWTDAVAAAFGHRVYRLAALIDGKPAAILPLVEIRSLLFGRALISTGFAVAGGPLGTDAAAAHALLGHAQALGRERGAGYIELRDGLTPGEGWLSRDDLYAGFARPIALDEQACLKQIPRKQRAVVRHALAERLTATVDRDVETFFALYARTMRNHGTPAFPKHYFRALIELFPESCDILTVWDGPTALNSVLSFYFRNRVLPYYTGSRSEARDKGSNDLMYWHLMRHAVTRGYRIFDFGRSKIGTGPFAFKRHWGFEPRPIAHWYRLLGRDTLPNVSPANPRYAALIALWRRLPLPLANMLSRPISRNLA
jgi:FemAB-related protein (PEP-CTERM system-associated)